MQTACTLAARDQTACRVGTRLFGNLLNGGFSWQRKVGRATFLDLRTLGSYFSGLSVFSPSLPLAFSPFSPLAFSPFSPLVFSPFSPLVFSPLVSPSAFFISFVVSSAA